MKNYKQLNTQCTYDQMMFNENLILVENSLQNVVCTIFERHTLGPISNECDFNF